MNQNIATNEQVGGHHVCPWWLAYFFDNPLRRLLHPVDKVVGPYVSEGMTTLDFGCGFGHFSLGMARLVGDTGRVLAVDLQQKMLDKAMSRAKRAGLDSIVQAHRCSGESMDVHEAGTFDFILSCNSLHETPDPERIAREVKLLLKPGGRFLLLEPRGHMKAASFEDEVAVVAWTGLKEVDRPEVRREMGALFERP